MKKIYFKSDREIGNIGAALYKNGKISLMAEGPSASCDLYSVDFDGERFDALHFDIGDGARSGIVYPGELSLGVEYKKNERLDRDLTYLFANGVERTGRVENHLLRDDINLSYRDDRSKRISVFLPDSYDCQIPHDILYFFDAQNLFCSAGDYTDKGDPYGSWQIDLLVDMLRRQYGRNIIVVGIDNSDEYRSHELFMDPCKFGQLSLLATAIPEDDFSHGYLDGLSSFMVSTLHSFIKKNYCVREDNIGIGGSSMGGIASFYCAMRELGFYKYVLSYSPAYGLYEMSAFENYFNSFDFSKQDSLPLIHIYCGGGDMLEEMLLPSARAMKPLLVKHGYPAERIFETYDMEKPHNEESWRLVLGESFTRLLRL